MKEKEDNIMDNTITNIQVEQQRATALVSITTSLLTGMCANPEFWIAEGKKLGVPDDQPSVVVLAAVALEQAETLIMVLSSAQQARAANLAAAKEDNDKAGANDD